MSFIMCLLCGRHCDWGSSKFLLFSNWSLGEVVQCGKHFGGAFGREGPGLTWDECP